MKRLFVSLAIIAVLCTAMGILDFFRVSRFEKPIFCIPAEIADDGGSGRYVGIGYSFDIEGNFMPEDEFPGVTKYEAKIFGITVGSEARE